MGTKLSGHTSTVTFGSSAFTADIVSIEGNEFTRPELDASHLLTPNFVAKCPGDLTAAGGFTSEFFFDPDAQPPIDGTIELATITFPVPPGLTNGATLSGTGFGTSFSWGPLENNNLIRASYTFTFDGGEGDPGGVVGVEPTWVASS